MKRIAALVFAFCAVASAVCADDFTDIIQALAVNAASLGTYDVSRSSSGSAGNYYSQQIWNERFAAEYGNLATRRTFYGVCHDYTMCAYVDILEATRKYNRAGMMGDEYFMVIADTSVQVELEKVTNPENATVNYTNGISAKKYGDRNVLTHKNSSGKRASNHAWLWIRRDDGVWFWIDPTWTDNVGYVVWGYVANGEEIQLKPDKKLCMRWEPYLDNLPDPPARGPAIKAQPSTRVAQGSSSSSGSPSSSGSSSIHGIGILTSVGFSLPPSSGVFEGDFTDFDNFGVSLAVETGNGPLFCIVQGDWYLFETQSILASIALGWQIANIFGVYAGGGLGVAFTDVDSGDSHLAWKAFAGARLMFGEAFSLRADVSYVRDLGLAIGASVGWTYPWL